MNFRTKSNSVCGENEIAVSNLSPNVHGIDELGQYETFSSE